MHTLLQAIVGGGGERANEPCNVCLSITMIISCCTLSNSSIDGQTSCFKIIKASVSGVCCNKSQNVYHTLFYHSCVDLDRNNRSLIENSLWDNQ